MGAGLRTVPGSSLRTDPHPPWPRWTGELASLVYIAIIATIANVTGAFYIMFPELGALSHDVFTRPRGTWARAPILLAITPVLTGVAGTIFTRTMPYGFASVLLTVGAAVLIIELLDSPVAPAISAGLLPLVVGIRSWWYAPGIMLGTFLLAGLSLVWKEYAEPLKSTAKTAIEDAIQDTIELPSSRLGWLIALFAFVAFAVLLVTLTGWRFILFPPLVVIGFEMLGHPEICPWARRPLWLPLACFLTAAGGFFFWHLFGVGPLAAACAMVWGIAVLRVFDLHVPPALAVALLPLVMDHPTAIYPVSVGIGTLTMTIWFLLYRRIFNLSS